MTMILQLLVAAVAVGLGVDARYGSPVYKQYVQAIEETVETLEKNLLSMEGNIPLLNDYRRHYAEIVHVVYSMGRVEFGCTRIGYDKIYPEVLNTSAPNAINHPEEVVDEVRKDQVVVNNIIGKLKTLINACVQETEVCNELIDHTVSANPDQYRHPAKVLLAAGDIAMNLNKLNEKFEQVSKDLKAHQYVITSPKDLEIIVYAVASLRQELFGTALKC